MKNNIFLYLILIGLSGLLLSCEKDGDKVLMLENPIAPSIVEMPTLTLERANGLNVLEFKATPVDPGFSASAKYFLEAAAAGTEFASPVTVYSGDHVESMKISVSELNGLLLTKFPADMVSSIDFRLRALLVVDAGTGAEGTGNKPFRYLSETKTVDVTLYGLPRLDLLNSGAEQKIESALGDGVYSGLVVVDDSQPFTLKDPDTDLEYGLLDKGKLIEGGATASLEEDGWYILTADINELTYVLKANKVGLIGSATPGGWDDDSRMDYNSETDRWSITVDLIGGEFIKFRMNDNWSGGINLGYYEDAPDLGNLQNDGGSKDILIAESGNYTIELFIGASTYSCTITKN